MASETGPTGIRGKRKNVLFRYNRTICTCLVGVWHSGQRRLLFLRSHLRMQSCRVMEKWKTNANRAVRGHWCLYSRGIKGKTEKKKKTMAVFLPFEYRKNAEHITVLHIRTEKRFKQQWQNFEFHETTTAKRRHTSPNTWPHVVKHTGKCPSVPSRFSKQILQQREEKKSERSAKYSLKRMSWNLHSINFVILEPYWTIFFYSFLHPQSWALRDCTKLDCINTVSFSTTLRATQKKILQQKRRSIFFFFFAYAFHAACQQQIQTKHWLRSFRTNVDSILWQTTKEPWRADEIFLIVEMNDNQYHWISFAMN